MKALDEQLEALVEAGVPGAIALAAGLTAADKARRASPTSRRVLA